MSVLKMNITCILSVHLWNIELYQFTTFRKLSKSNCFVKLLNILSDAGMVTYRNAMLINCGFAGDVASALKYSGLYLYSGWLLFPLS